jgi:hypothetical protein
MPLNRQDKPITYRATDHSLHVLAYLPYVNKHSNRFMKSPCCLCIFVILPLDFLNQSL